MHLQSLPAFVAKDSQAVFVSRGSTKLKFTGKKWYKPIKELIHLASKPTTKIELMHHFDANIHSDLLEIITTLIENNIFIVLKNTTPQQKRSSMAEEIFYWHFNENITSIEKILASTKIALIGVNDFSKSLTHLLINSGFTNCELFSHPRLDKYDENPNAYKNMKNLKSFNCLIAIAPCNQRQTLREINKQCLDNKIAYYPILVNNLRAYIGPYVFPERPPCFECASLRFAANLDNTYNQSIEEQAEKAFYSSKINGYHPCMISAVTSFICMELINIFTHLTTKNMGEVTNLCLLNQKASRSRIITIPECPSCQETQKKMPSTVVEKNAQIEKLIPELVDKNFGIVQHIDRFHSELPIPQIYHYFSYQSNTRAFSNQENVRYGKGVAITETRALQKALGEGIERYCSAIYDKTKLLTSSFENICDDALPPDNFCHYSEEFYLAHSRYSHFNYKTIIKWEEALNLRTKTEIYIPASMTYLPYRHDRNESKIIQNISTGLACHSSYENAAINAICEIIERDAFMIFWRNRLSPPQIDLKSIPQHIQTLLGNYKRKGFNIKLFNLTTDISVPVILALMETQHNDQPPLVISGACDTSAEKAILSAVEELEHARQHGYYLLHQEKKHHELEQTLVKTQKDHVRFWHNRENLHLAKFLQDSKERTSYNQLCKLNITHKEHRLEQLSRKLFNLGMEIYIADITSKDIVELGLFVLRAIIPSAHPLAFGYGYENFNCERLLTVPKHLGYKNVCLKLNLTPHPYP